MHNCMYNYIRINMHLFFHKQCMLLKYYDRYVKYADSRLNETSCIWTVKEILNIRNTLSPQGFTHSHLNNLMYKTVVYSIASLGNKTIIHLCKSNRFLG